MNCGRSICLHCDGSGKIMLPSIEGKAKCPYCKGTGRTIPIPTTTRKMPYGGLSIERK